MGITKGLKAFKSFWLLTIFILAFKYLDKNEDNQNTGVSSTYFNCTAMDIAIKILQAL